MADADNRQKTLAAQRRAAVCCSVSLRLPRQPYVSALRQRGRRPMRIHCWRSVASSLVPMIFRPASPPGSGVFLRPEWKISPAVW